MIAGVIGREMTTTWRERLPKATNDHGNNQLEAK
jgi:hypothetical protein